MSGYWHEAITFLLRWLHVVAAIAWIGESFYFVMLDRALKPGKKAAPGVFGELWSVHGGGFYHKQKYAVAPAQMPDDLHWSKWKSYTTWLSGFALLSALYLASPQVYLVDPAVRAMDGSEAVGWALVLLICSWLIYDLLCRLVGLRDALLGVLVSLLVALLSWIATELFAGRAAFLLVGASLATIMSANVFFVIIPGQKKMVAALARGEQPDPLPGLRGKQRSVHNTYFTLPVVFAMLSIHYASAYAHQHNWLVLLAFMAAGALIRQFFVLWHSGGRAWWLLGAGAAALLAAFALMAPRPQPAPAAPAPASADPVDPTISAALQPEPTTDNVLPILHTHCNACHAAQPTLLPSAPAGLVLETAAQVEAQRMRIYQQVSVLKIMPPGNMTGMTETERELVGRWGLGR